MEVSCKHLDRCRPCHSVIIPNPHGKHHRENCAQSEAITDESYGAITRVMDTHI